VTVIFFLFNVLPGDPAQMMLGQNEDSKQLAIVKQKYGFDKPLSTQYLYYLNDLSLVSFHSKNSNDYTFLRDGKYSAIPLFSIGNTTTVVKFPYLRESFTKQGKKVNEVIT
jgi:peptide/nickel transport system permease protein